MKHEHVPGLSAKLLVNGLPLEEFEEPEADNHDNLTTTRFVKSFEGANFTVHVEPSRSFLYPRDDIKCVIYLDGKAADSLVLLKDDFSRKGIHHIGRTKTTSSGNHVHKFMFSKLATHDGAVQSTARKDLMDLGTITLKLIRCEMRRSYSAQHSDIPRLGRDSVAEKGLKGRSISTQAVLDKPVKVHHETRYCDVSYPYGREPFAIFTFKYRSHKDLQAEGIIARSPSPVPLEERDPATLSRDELRELLRRRDEEVKALTRVKRERSTTLIGDGEGDDGDAVVLTQPPLKRARPNRVSGVGIIDLTED